jgi:hypothetical protein
VLRDAALSLYREEHSAALAPEPEAAKTGGILVDLFQDSRPERIRHRECAADHRPDRSFRQALSACVARIFFGRGSLRRRDSRPVTGMTTCTAYPTGKQRIKIRRGVSEAKLHHCMTQLGRDVKIVAGPARRRVRAGHIEVSSG